MRYGLVLSLFTILLCVSMSSADLQSQRRPDFDQQIPGGISRSYPDHFVGKARAVAIVSGNGRSCLGLYVFDADGNCVASDDISSAQAADDLAADWIPAETARYDVHVRNAGFDQNAYRLVLR